MRWRPHTRRQLLRQTRPPGPGPPLASGSPSSPSRLSVSCGSLVPCACFVMSAQNCIVTWGNTAADGIESKTFRDMVKTKSRNSAVAAALGLQQLTSHR